MRLRLALKSILCLSLLGAAGHCPAAEPQLLNASYDVSRELYKVINPAFSAAQVAAGKPAVDIAQSHGGSSKQALAVSEGLQADVVTMNQAPDIDMLVSKGLVDARWRDAFPYQAAPYTTLSVFLVRKGNPQHIHDWNDLARPGLQVIIPNPKTSGNGRYAYLAAWGYALARGDSTAQATQFLRALFANVPVLDGGGRGATTTFTQRGIGDVLVTFENEAVLIANELGDAGFERVYPSISVSAEAPVAIVSEVVDHKGTRQLATDYLDFLFTPQGQELIAQQHFRPRDPAVLARHQREFPTVRTFSVEERLGPWPQVMATHFADGALYDQIMSAGR